MANSFSSVVLDQNSEAVEVLKDQFAESVRAQERARKAMNALAQRMTKQELQLKKHEKDHVRSGRKNFNKQSFNEFVVSYLGRCKSEKHIDEIVAAALNTGFVSTNKDGLRSSVCRALQTMAGIKNSGVKSLGNGFYSA